MKDKIKTIIVDDHKFYRETLRMIIQELGYCEIIAEATNGKEFLSIIQNQHADLVFMDIKMPEIDGIEATRIATLNDRFLKVIALTIFEEKEYFLKMMEVGAKGFLLKDSGKEELENCIKTVLEGKNYYPKGLAKQILLKNFH